jgi:hypothetical protein
MAVLRIFCAAPGNPLLAKEDPFGDIPFHRAAIAGQRRY